MLKHLQEQSANIRALVRIAGSSVRGAIPSRSKSQKAEQSYTAPGPLYRSRVRPPSTELVSAYLKFLGNSGASPEFIPAHLFPQWAFPLMAEALAATPYPIAKVVNAGCSLASLRDLPRRDWYGLEVQLTRIEESPNKTLLELSIATGPMLENGDLDPDFVLQARTTVLIPKRTRSASNQSKKLFVPADAVSLKTLNLSASTARQFALLTGDLNPIHWLSPYAKLSGFRSVILHGFASVALLIEETKRSTVKNELQTSSIEAKFLRPCVLPNRPRCLWDPTERQLFLADGVSTTPYAVIQLKDER